MPFGILTPEMEAVVQPLIRDHVVWDLGAGDLTHAQRMLTLGARQVVAVDKNLSPQRLPWGIQGIRAYFEAVKAPPEGIHVAFLSWPVNRAHQPGLVPLLAASRVVIYLGSNMDGSACGGKALFRYLSGRAVLGHVPHTHNTLITYGDPLPDGEGSRPLIPEEWVALHDEQVWSLHQSTEQAGRG